MQNKIKTRKNSWLCPCGFCIYLRVHVPGLIYFIIFARISSSAFFSILDTYERGYCKKGRTELREPDLTHPGFFQLPAAKFDDDFFFLGQLDSLDQADKQFFVAVRGIQKIFDEGFHVDFFDF